VTDNVILFSIFIENPTTPGGGVPEGRRPAENRKIDALNIPNTAPLTHSLNALKTRPKEGGWV
jgi:hypothetical protein